MWMHTKHDRRLDNSFPTFEKYRNSLKIRCENGSEPGILEFTPNSSWPDVVYYGSYYAPNMGWKINVVDSLGYSPASASPRLSPLAPTAAALFLSPLLINYI
jgi:hypothetical protein